MIQHKGCCSIYTCVCVIVLMTPKISGYKYYTDTWQDAMSIFVFVKYSIWLSRSQGKKINSCEYMLYYYDIESCWGCPSSCMCYIPPDPQDLDRRFQSCGYIILIWLSLRDDAASIISSSLIYHIPYDLNGRFKSSGYGITLIWHPWSAWLLQCSTLE